MEEAKQTKDLEKKERDQLKRHNWKGIEHTEQVGFFKKKSSFSFSNFFVLIVIFWEFWNIIAVLSTKHYSR